MRKLARRRVALLMECAMLVRWRLSGCKLKQNQILDQILNYVNELCERLRSPMGESAVDCGSFSSLPCVSFTVGGRKFELTPEQVYVQLQKRSYHKKNDSHRRNGCHRCSLQ